MSEAFSELNRLKDKLAISDAVIEKAAYISVSSEVICMLHNCRGTCCRSSLTHAQPPPCCEVLTNACKTGNIAC